MPLSFSAVRAPPQSPVSVSCSQIEVGCFALSSACARNADREGQRRGSRE